ncbi:MAG: aminoacetone oxidase family FAD-binding enzyme [Clostridiales bacterium]|nr:aminoacetone oxidase family FAD-binding enzyme [Clostridiales bacterium]
MKEEGRLKVGIIGGGAAGLFTACQLKKLGLNDDIEITILEKTSTLGKKLTLTGHGRCNITNRKTPSEFKKGLHEAGNFLYPAIKEFSPDDTVRFFEEDLGLKLKEEDNNRMFPVCDSAVKVRDTIVSYISDKVKTICDAKVLDIAKTDGFDVYTTKGDFKFDILVLSCGGASFPETGSTGDSYAFASGLGHTVEPIRAALAPVKVDKVSRQFTSALSGVSVNANASLYCSGSKSASSEGDVLFADFGLTGPAIMELSREIPTDIVDMNGWIELDFTPFMSDEQIDKEFQKMIDEHPDTKVSTLASKYVPSSVSRELSARAKVTDLYAQNFTKQNRKALCKEIKHLELGIEEAPNIDKAYVTRGGVRLKEVDKKTMQSTIVSGLYIIGEALDIDGISGGYNLQACMSEAYAVSKSILG